MLAFCSIKLKHNVFAMKLLIVLWLPSTNLHLHYRVICIHPHFHSARNTLLSLHSYYVLYMPTGWIYSIQASETMFSPKHTILFVWPSHAWHPLMSYPNSIAMSTPTIHPKNHRSETRVCVCYPHVHIFTNELYICMYKPPRTNVWYISW